MESVDSRAVPSRHAVGQPLQRKEDHRLLLGQGRFTDDFRFDGQAHAAIVRSPHPHARIVAIDAQSASQAPGVIGVLTGADCIADGLRPIPHSPLPSTRDDMKLHGPGGAGVFSGPHALLAADLVRHVGEAVAVVIARTPQEAIDAAERVQIDYAPLAWVVDALSAMQPGAPALWPEVADNVLVDTRFGDSQGTARAFAQADHVVELDYHVSRVTAVTMEPRACLGAYDAAAGRYTLYAGSGGAVRHKRELATVLGIEPDRLRVLSLDVGGNFGARNRVYAEFGLVLWAARKFGVPVKYTAARSESFTSDYQGRDLHTRVALALRADGRFLALRADNVSNVGARCVSLSPLSKGSGLITGSYDIPIASLRSRAVFTNTMPTQAYRSSGRPEVTFAIERVIDKAAVQLGIDRIELRRRNLVPAGAMPYRNAVGMRYDSGTYESNMDLAMRIADWDGFDVRAREAAIRSRLLGRGLANYVESSIGTPRERAELEVTPAGRLRVVIGTQPSGQGHETSFAQVTAQLLGAPIDNIDIVMGDTDVVSVGGGSHSGRSLRHAATVISIGARELIERGRKLVAHIEETTAAEVEFADGRFRVRGSERTFELLGLGALVQERFLPRELQAPFGVAADNEMHDPVFPNGCAVCECEVDPETGAVTLTRYAAVDDVGRCVNPMIVHGQTHGGIAQGVGQALSEWCFVDPASGQVLTGSLQDYCVPRADDLPGFQTEIVEVLSPTNPFGIKAGGEGGTTPALAAVVSAIVDALRSLGVTEIEMPATPFRVWQAIQAARCALPTPATQPPSS